MFPYEARHTRSRNTVSATTEGCSSSLGLSSSVLLGGDNGEVSGQTRIEIDFRHSGHYRQDFDGLLKLIISILNLCSQLLRLSFIYPSMSI